MYDCTTNTKHYTMCSILRHMWQVSVESVEKCLEEAPLNKGTDSAQLHRRLVTTLETMKDFYHCGGNGLQEKELCSDCYKVIIAKPIITVFIAHYNTLLVSGYLLRKSSAQIAIWLIAKPIITVFNSLLYTLCIRIFFYLHSSVYIDTVFKIGYPKLTVRGAYPSFLLRFGQTTV